MNTTTPVIAEEDIVQFTDEYEEALIIRAKEDPHEFGKLFDKYYKRILNYILHRVANVALAEELTSNTFFNALNKLSSFKWKNVPFSAWLYRIATNEINGHFRKSKKNKFSSINELSEFIKDEDSLADIELKKEEKHIAQEFLFHKLNKALLKLKPIYQEVIVLRFFEKKNISEISLITKKVDGTVKSLLHRGLKKLENELGPSIYEDFKND